jgi:hypothetical protein
MLTDLLNALVILQNDTITISNTQQTINNLQTQLSTYASQDCVYIVPQDNGRTIFFVALPLAQNWWPGQFSIPTGVYTGIELATALNAAPGNTLFVFTFDAKNILVTMTLKIPSPLQGFFCYEANPTSSSLAKLLHFPEPNIAPSNQMNSAYTTTVTSTSSPKCYVSETI